MKNKNSRAYPKVYVDALARQARQELKECQNKREMFHLNILLHLIAEDEHQNEILIVLQEMDNQGSFDRLAWTELLNRLIEFV